jgi:Skp family chaperone for outer membrane proteins
MKNDEKKKLEKLIELQKMIEGSPLIQQIETEKAAAILARRKEAAGKIEVLKKEQEETILRLQAELEAKEAKYKNAKTALDAAAGEFQAARSARSSESQSFDTAISRQEQILIETADPVIDEAISFFIEKLDFLRSPGRINRTACGSEKNLILWNKNVKEETNVAAVHSAILYCQSAIKNLQALKLSPEFHIKKIEELKTAIPSIDEYQEVTVEKNLGKGP